MSRLLSAALAALGLVGVASVLGGCTTESYCFADCTGSVSLGGHGGVIGLEDSGPPIIIGSGGAENGGSSGSSNGGGPDGGTCLTTELCNGLDDNCNGQVDENLDYTDPYQCGICNHNCRQLVQGVPQSQVTCTPPDAKDLGNVAGVCGFSGDCEPDYWDNDKDKTNGCEFYCTSNPTRQTTTDADNNGKCGVDDDCDGQTDEDLNTDSDPKNCGACGHSCVFVNGAGKCAAGQCQIDKCDDGWFNPPGGEGCWYKCTPTNGGKEICDGIDNDCDNLVDNADPDIQTNEPTIGTACQGGTQGVCADPANAGILKCVLPEGSPSFAVACCDVDSNNVNSDNPALPKTGLRNGVCAGAAAPKVVRPGKNPEICNNLDDDCNGQTDDNPSDSGSSCGSFSQGICLKGVNQCQGGALVCVGKVDPAASDPCNGVDDDCDGVTDGTIPAGTPTTCTSNAGCSGGTVCLPKASGGKVCATPPAEVGTDCNIPPTPPCVNSAGQEVACTTSGATPVPQPCKKGGFVCTGGTLTCQGAIGKTATKDLCGEDSNCDGRLDNQPNLLTDIANCGSCGNDCNALGAHVNWTCSAGKCVPGATKCKSGFIDCDGNANDCERACTKSGNELCNGFDDNCNCQVDEGVTAPDPSQVCGVSGTASDPKCGAGNGTTGIKVSCASGKWTCQFPAGYCNQGSPPSCGTTTDVCDGVDNNCNGATDENYKQPVLTTGYLGQPCASDDGKAPPGDGACQGTGSFVCNGTSATKCNAVRDNTKAGAELCDGEDNDCDGSVDEAFNAKGTNATYFVKPAVVKTGASTWMFQYEASRPNATDTTAGTGNGYWCGSGGCASGVPAAPTGTTLDKTPACSVPSKIPWFNVTPAEAEEVCSAMGGSVCSTPNWTAACTNGANACKWGYGTTACKTGANYTSGPFCNLAPYDTDQTAGAPNSDWVLPTKSPLLNQCWASYGATPATTGIFDLTGNLREITKRGNEDYPLMGGAFSTDAESGAQCDFTFFSITSTLKLFDTGFRCCFSSDPTL
ncbi:MAG TPA: MopE-related protein [Polyangiaceae bacterium]|nr:MopE-related protein [Polyangiaceae bacterium]